LSQSLIKSVVRDALMHYGIWRYRKTLLQDERQGVFRIDAGPSGDSERYVLRIYWGADHDPRAIESQMRWLDALGRETSVVVSEPVRNLRGGYVTSLGRSGEAGASFCTLTRWVRGRKCFFKTGPGPETLRQVGRVMAQIHAHGLNLRRRGRVCCPAWDWGGLFGRTSRWHPAQRPALTAEMANLMSRVMRLARRVMQQLGTGPSVFGLIHGDLIQANYLMHEGKTGVIDFADFGRGYFLYDMAVTLLMLRQFEGFSEKRAAFVEGYREVRPLSDEHEELLDMFIAIRGMVLARWILGSESAQRSDLGWARRMISGAGELISGS
jgi:Ser/Thr protein kinase RdoA (MazF antagonist)